MSGYGNTIIILLGLLGGVLLLGGVGYSAYSRVKRIGRSGMRMDDLLRNIGEAIENEASQAEYTKKGAAKKTEKDNKEG